MQKAKGNWTSITIGIMGAGVAVLLAGNAIEGLLATYLVLGGAALVILSLLASIILALLPQPNAPRGEAMALVSLSVVEILRERWVGNQADCLVGT